MKTYSILKTVAKDNLDHLNHVNNVVYVYWIQEIAKKHWQKVAESLAVPYTWVVRRHDITYYHAAKLDDEIAITTNIKTTKGSISFREVEMKNNKTGKLLVKSITEWCLLDSKTLKPIRVPDTIKNLFLKS